MNAVYSTNTDELKRENEKKELRACARRYTYTHAQIYKCPDTHRNTQKHSHKNTHTQTHTHANTCTNKEENEIQTENRLILEHFYKGEKRIKNVMEWEK